MNIILFEDRAPRYSLPPDDPKAVHIRSILRMGPGARLDVGVIHGPRGKAVIAGDDPEHGMTLDVTWLELPEPLHPFHLIAGLPRPQTARRLLFSAASLGFRAVTFFQSDHGERGYAQSRLWVTGEWRRHLVEGAEQAFHTGLPDVRHTASLVLALERVPDSGPARIALDVYEGSAPLLAIRPAGEPVVLALGNERGWSAAERDLLRRDGFRLVHLGSRILRMETACAVGFAVIAAKRNWLR